MKYFTIDTLGNLNDPRLCVLDEVPEGVGIKYYCMMKGKRIGADYPADAKLYMSDKYTGIKLSSLIGNTKSYLIVCGEMKDVIDSHCSAEVEYLPFTLYNHKKRIHSKNYFIVNPIGALDCLNLEASKIKYFKDRVVSVDKFVLDPKKLANAPSLFRIKEDPTEYVINQQLANAIKEGKFTNVVLREIEQVESR